MAKERRPLELPEQRLGEFLEGIRQNDCLREGAQGAQEIERALQRAQGADDTLDVSQLQAALVENVEPEFHEFVVIRFVARGAAQFRDAGLLGNRNPDFRRQHALHVQGHDGLLHRASFSGIISPVQWAGAEALPRASGTPSEGSVPPSEGSVPLFYT